MDKISEAAWKRAGELCDAGQMLNGHSICFSTLARVLQEHSDVAKEAHQARKLNLAAIGKYLDYFILPEEPLDDLTVVEGYQLQPDGTRARVRVALRDMRIVEADDD